MIVTPLFIRIGMSRYYAVRNADVGAQCRNRSPRHLELVSDSVIKPELKTDAIRRRGRTLRRFVPYSTPFFAGRDREILALCPELVTFRPNASVEWGSAHNQTAATRQLFPSAGSSWSLRYRWLTESYPQNVPPFKPVGGRGGRRRRALPRVPLPPVPRKVALLMSSGLSPFT